VPHGGKNHPIYILPQQILSRSLEQHIKTSKDPEPDSEIGLDDHLFGLVGLVQVPLAEEVVLAVPTTTDQLICGTDCPTNRLTILPLRSKTTSVL
jgi:hypothetical protein